MLMIFRIHFWLWTMNRMGCGIKWQTPQLREEQKTLVTHVLRGNSEFRRNIASKLNSPLRISRSSNKAREIALHWTIRVEPRQQTRHIPSNRRRGLTSIVNGSRQYMPMQTNYFADNDHMHVFQTRFVCMSLCDVTNRWLMNLLFGVGLSACLLFCPHCARQLKNWINWRPNASGCKRNKETNCRTETDWMPLQCVCNMHGLIIAIAQVGNMSNVHEDI